MKITHYFTFQNRKKLKTAAEVIVFLVIILSLFTGTMHLFRTQNHNRDRLKSIKSEDVDVVYIGGSAAYAYWQPHKAWKDFGFSSYVYGSDTLQAEAIKYYIKAVQKTQDPVLYIIDARPFQYWEEEASSDSLIGLQYSLDNIRLLDPNRFALAYEYWKNHTFSNKGKTPFSLLDITKEHSNTDNLGYEYAWDYAFGKVTSPLNGHEMIARSEPFSTPEDFMTEKREDLHPTCQKVLVDLLDWCKEQGHDVLFVVCPYVINEEYQEKYNSISDIISEYGFSFLNANEYYAEMDMDFYSDFYDANHVNPVGAEKYTAFLANYVWNNYTLPTVTEAVLVEEWASEYEYYTTRQEKAAETVKSTTQEAELVKKRCLELQKNQDFTMWSMLAQDDDIVLLTAQSGTIHMPESSVESNILQRWGFTDTSSGRIARIVNSESKEKSDMELNGSLDIWGLTPYSIYADDKGSVITVGETEYVLNEAGIHIVAFDNKHREVVDVIRLQFVDGCAVFQR